MFYIFCSRIFSHILLHTPSHILSLIYTITHLLPSILSCMLAAYALYILSYALASYPTHWHPTPHVSILSHALASCPTRWHSIPRVGIISRVLAIGVLYILFSHLFSYSLLQTLSHIFSLIYSTTYLLPNILSRALAICALYILFSHLFSSSLLHTPSHIPRSAT